jgi:hypothetical protein
MYTLLLLKELVSGRTYSTILIFSLEECIDYSFFAFFCHWILVSDINREVKMQWQPTMSSLMLHMRGWWILIK